jgi:hypothetical protein
MTAWNEMSNMQKAVSVLGGFFVAGTIAAFLISDYRGLPDDVRALSRVDSVTHARIVRDSLRIVEGVEANETLRCLILELFKQPSQRLPQECPR